MIIGKREIDPTTLTVNITCDMGKVERHFFGLFRWRLFVARQLIAIGAWIINSDIEFKINEE